MSLSAARGKLQREDVTQGKTDREQTLARTLVEVRRAGGYLARSRIRECRPQWQRKCLVI
jgi:hypothetical protein